MNGLIAIIAFTILTSCNSSKTENKKVDSKKVESKTLSFDSDRLNEYFAQYEIRPSITVYNTGGYQTEVQLAKHKVKWLNTFEETKIMIDNDLFTLKDKVTINVVWQNNDSVDFVNNWDEMKLYKINERALIGIRMSFEPCSGLGCGVNYFLVYDLQTKAKNFFGTFRTDNKLALYDFNNDNKLDYISKTFNGDAHGATPIDFIYELYSMGQNGHFERQKDSSGKVYQIIQTTVPNDTSTSETLEKHWFTEIR